MSNFYNPYKSALDGLFLNDPVSAFFDFCRERENIREKREMGLSPPWSKNTIFQRGRFLNVFREDDRGSKAIFLFAKHLNNNLPNLVQSLFFARWCNRQETLIKLTSEDLSNPYRLSKKLNNFSQWCNKTAYPVEPVQWKKQKYSRLDTATHIFFQAKELLSDIIKDTQGSVIKATNEINKIFKMENDFPIFMAIMDIAWFRPDVISPNSHVPIGIGAIAYMDRLQSHLKLNDHIQTCNKMISLQNKFWPEAKRDFHPIDIEYISCECRKYYSYVNGTKFFKGKNLFTPKL